MQQDPYFAADHKPVDFFHLFECGGTRKILGCPPHGDSFAVDKTKAGIEDMEQHQINSDRSEKSVHSGIDRLVGAKPLPKPDWLRGKSSSTPEVLNLVKILRDNRLHTVCEQAACPNMGECFRKGTATFMIMGDICTRQCPFCNVGHGMPEPLRIEEAASLARAVQIMKLKYVVVTSVTRDDLPDGGAGHYGACIRAVRLLDRSIQIEVLTPDFRGVVKKAFEQLRLNPPDVFNHNLETVPRMYARVRPQADYHGSLELLRCFRETFPEIPTKSGLMLGLGETEQEIQAVMRDLRRQNCSMLTLGQYMRPSPRHLPVERYVAPEEFQRYRDFGISIGFSHVESGPMVRSSYHADLQAKEIIQKSK
jgi:lipoic acid synthetase